MYRHGFGISLFHKIMPSRSCIEAGVGKAGKDTPTSTFMTYLLWGEEEDEVRNVSEGSDEEAVNVTSLWVWVWGKGRGALQWVHEVFT